MKEVLKKFIRLSILMVLPLYCTACTTSDSSTQEESVTSMEVEVTTSEDSQATTLDTTISLEDEQNSTEQKVQAILDGMTLEEKIYQMFIVTPEDLSDVSPVTQADDTTKAYLERYPVGGIIYFASNLESETQTIEMLSNTQQYMQDINGIGLFMCVDEEGGNVSRVYKSLGTTTELQPMQYYGELADSQQAYDIGATLANDISQYGFNLDFAPVSDVDANMDNGLHELGRCFSDDPQIVALMVSNVVKGLQDNGVSACIKHFPGLGSTDADTHDGLVYVERTKEEFEDVDLIPIKAGIESGVDFVMVSHMTIDNLSDGAPCDLSKSVVTGWLREELGYDGIAITDSHQMNSITDYYGNSSAMLAIMAGIDIVLMPQDLEESFNRVYEAVQNGIISESRIDESVTRILTQKAKLNLI
jgi:beta-N-acetylhexosaminidase